MRAIVQGLLFDSDKAERVFSWGANEDSPGSILYLTTKGNWFLVADAERRQRGIVRRQTPGSVATIKEGKGPNAMEMTVTMITEEQAKGLMLRNGANVELVLRFVDNIEEA